MTEAERAVLDAAYHYRDTFAASQDDPDFLRNAALHSEMVKMYGALLFMRAKELPARTKEQPERTE